jgi:hypothetical protein
MFQPKPRWIEQGDSQFLTWGHVKVGEVTAGGNGTWYAYAYDATMSGFRSLKAFPAEDLAMREVEVFLADAAEPR